MGSVIHCTWAAIEFGLISERANNCIRHSLYTTRIEILLSNKPAAENCTEPECIMLIFFIMTVDLLFSELN